MDAKIDATQNFLGVDRVDISRVVAQNVDFFQQILRIHGERSADQRGFGHERQSHPKHGNRPHLVEAEANDPLR